MRVALASAILLALVAGAGAARTMETSPRPKPRVANAAAPVALPRVPVAYDAAIRPRARPQSEGAAEPASAPVFAVMVRYDAAIRPQPRPLRAARPARVIEVSSGAALTRSARPEPRPRTPYQTAALVAAGLRSQPSSVLTGREGAICGDRAIRGQVLAPIPGRIKGCGVDKPVRVTSVAGVSLTRPATMDCVTAAALKSWVADGVKPTVGRLGGGVASVKVIADYACRTRNNRPGAKISEHGRGRAVDVAAINLKNGVALTVLDGWRDPAQGKLLRRMHAAACGPFGTVLGPGSDGFHKDHIHLDTARYRGGAYCR